MNDTNDAGNRAAQLTELLATAPEPTDHPAMREFLSDLIAAGLEVLLIRPGTKVPADCRTRTAKTHADKAAREAAKAAGDRLWAKRQAPAGVHLATGDSDTLDGYLEVFARRFGDEAPMNVAVVPGRSGLVVVDADTADQMAEFLADAGLPEGAEPTVRSPGQRGADGAMVHKDGGHFWFVLPNGVELPDAADGMTLPEDDGGWAALWGAGKYVLIPPSQRDEGRYETTGTVEVLPDWLAEQIADAGKRAALAAALRAGRAAGADYSGTGGNQTVTRWGAGTTWAEILADADGWTPAGMLDGCGCEVWTAPGLHASPKSATAHERGCGLHSSSPDPVLHLWTDHDADPFGGYLPAAGGTGTVTRLQAVAAIHFNNNMGATMSALDDAFDPLVLDDDLDADQDRQTGPEGVGGAEGKTGTGGTPNAGKAKRRLRITCAADIEPEPVDWLWVDISRHNTGTDDTHEDAPPDPLTVGDIALVAPGQTWTPPEVEFNGRIPSGMVTVAAGREGTGKSSFAIWLAANISRGTLPGMRYGTPRGVFYVATEDSWRHTLVPRLTAAGADLSQVFRVEAETHESATLTLSLPEDIDMLTESIIEREAALVVVDPLMSVLGSSINSNDSKEVRSALEPLARMADETGASVVGISHFNKATGLDAASRITGSGAFKDVARAVMVFSRVDDERVFSQPKNSVGSSDLPSLNYTITPAVVVTPKGKAATAVFAFTGIADASVDESLGNEHRRGGSGQGDKSAVEQFIANYITAHADPDTDDGGVPSAAVIAAGAKAGYSERQIKDARRRATDPVIATQHVGFGKDSYWVWEVVGKPGR